jgi:2'-5' RNA ligase
MRLFVAIEIPDDLKNELARLRVDIPGARWVATEQIHLTLAFLGEIAGADVGPLSEELSRIHSPAFKLRFAETGCFTDRRRPRVLWIGLEPEPHLIRLTSLVRGAILACGIPQEERHFSPHITLARLKAPPSREFDSFINPHNSLKLPPFSVREFILFQSLLNQRGAEHLPLRNFHLHSAS